MSPRPLGGEVAVSAAGEGDFSDPCLVSPHKLAYPSSAEFDYKLARTQPLKPPNRIEFAWMRTFCR